MTLLREPARTILLVASLALAITDIERPRTADADPRDQRVTTGAGVHLTLGPEELRGPAMRPLAVRKEFLWFFQAHRR
jgi:hypothetical protein